MKILLINTAKKGGRAKFALALARSLEENRDTDISVIEAAQTEYSARTEVTDISAFEFHKPHALIKTILGIRNKIREGSWDLVIFTSLHPVLSLLLPANSKPKVVYVSHDPMTNWDKKMFDLGIIRSIVFRIFARQIENKSERIILLNSSSRDYYRKKFGVNKVRTGFHPIFDHSNPSRSIEKKFDIGFFGRITPYKGIDAFLRVARLGENSHGWRSIIAGQGVLPSDANFLERCTIYNDWLDEASLVERILQTKVCVLPYNSASQSGIISLCHACHVPVVVPPIGGLPDQVEHGKTGIIACDSADKTIFEGVEEILLNEGNLESMEKCIEEENSRRGWDKLCEIITSPDAAAPFFDAFGEYDPVTRGETSSRSD